MGEVWRGGVHLPTGEESGEGAVPLPQKMLQIFELKMASFGAFWELILLQMNCLSCTHKPVSLDFGS